MPDPVVIPRAEHTLSRKDIDADALRVLYRLHHAGHIAYLVGGSVRDLLLGRRPKDFDIGTSAHPHQVKRLFRNCWIIGRRFRLAHIKFGTKVIEVATFRRLVPADTETPPVELPADAGVSPDAPDTGGEARLLHRDNTFGTAEEDAFRRDFTVNALFYDIATFSLIDYVGGREDLDARIIRCIGDPNVRFVEDPVRMLRAIVLAARLDFRLDPPIIEAIMRHKGLIGKAAPARLLEEYFKVLRSGESLRAFHFLGEVGLLQHITPEIPWPLPHAVEQSLSELDNYRGRFDRIPDTLTNTVLLGSLVAPIGWPRRRRRREPTDVESPAPGPAPTLGALPVARRDVERLDQLTSLQSRLADPDNLTPRTQRGLMHRAAFRDALTWLDVHGTQPEVVARWQALLAEEGRAPRLEPRAEAQGEDESVPRRRRRHRRRRRPIPSAR